MRSERTTHHSPLNHSPNSAFSSLYDSRRAIFQVGKIGSDQLARDQANALGLAKRVTVAGQLHLDLVVVSLLGIEGRGDDAALRGARFHFRAVDEEPGIRRQLDHELGLL